jgi:hypothetical protein
MAIIPQPSLFSWEKIDASSDLDRLRFVLEAIPDEALMRKLESFRGRGRNDYPVRAVWNSILAGIVYQHVSVASLRRELQRNGELRQVCGFDPFQGSSAVPPDWVYTRFLRALFRCETEINAMFDELVEKLRALLPDFGRRLVIDGKAIPSAGKPTDKNADGRRDADADWGTKTYKGRREDPSTGSGQATVWEKIVKWFGYKVHLIVDADCELPLAFEVTRASVNDTVLLRPLMKKLKEKHPTIVETAETCCADKGYDSTENNASLWDDDSIKPLIDIRHMWKDGEPTRALFSDRADNIVYDEDGAIFCVGRKGPATCEMETREMAFGGFEKNRMTLKYRCPAAAYGFECPDRTECGASGYGRIVRVTMETDRRLFVPIPRRSPQWTRLYIQRTAVERVNSRFDVSFGFERHFIRTLAKMKTRTGIALIVMLSMAVGAIHAGQKGKIRSLVWTVKKPRAA